MSRVRKNQKFMNTSKIDGYNYGASKVVRIHSENEDYHKVSSLKSWLFIKYNMSYKTYRNKSKERRDMLRDEFIMDTIKKSTF